MNETRSNSRTKPMKGGFKGEEMNSLKDSEKTNDLRIKGCLLHNSDLWKTPKFIYDYYMKKNFFDPCPSNPTFNGLEIPWKSFNFVNPPYSQINKWIDKALNERKRHCNSILLIPARTDTKWFRKLIENNVDILFLQGRLHFNDQGPAPFPSILVFIYNICDKTTFDYFNKEELIKYYK